MAGGIPGIPEQIGEDYMARRVKALERRVDELGPSLMIAVADAISSTVKTKSYQVETSGGFGVTSTYTTVLTQSITVPAGYSAVDLVTLGFALAVSNSATATYLHGLIVVNGAVGASAIDGPLVSSGDMLGSVTPGDARSLTGVSGATLDVALRIRIEAGPDWAFSTSSRGKLSILAIFHN